MGEEADPEQLAEEMKKVETLENEWSEEKAKLMEEIEAIKAECAELQKGIAEKK